MFTGDASGNFLFPALYRAGLASQPEATDRNDGLLLRGIWITAACRCVPPGNKPLPAELANCQRWLRYDVQGLRELKVLLALGSIAHDSYLKLLKAQGLAVQMSRYPFTHGALHYVDGALPLLDSYHVSYQNTNTGRLTAAMFDALLVQAKALAGL
jgi:uracil-DNA glycosylase family 4